MKILLILLAFWTTAYLAAEVPTDTGSGAPVLSSPSKPSSLLAVSAAAGNRAKATDSNTSTTTTTTTTATTTATTTTSNPSVAAIALPSATGSPTVQLGTGTPVAPVQTEQQLIWRRVQESAIQRQLQQQQASANRQGASVRPPRPMNVTPVTVASPNAATPPPPFGVFLPPPFDTTAAKPLPSSQLQLPLANQSVSAGPANASQPSLPSVSATSGPAQTPPSQNDTTSSSVPATREKLPSPGPETSNLTSPAALPKDSLVRGCTLDADKLYKPDQKAKPDAFSLSLLEPGTCTHLLLTNAVEAIINPNKQVTFSYYLNSDEVRALKQRDPQVKVIAGTTLPWIAGAVKAESPQPLQAFVQSLRQESFDGVNIDYGDATSSDDLTGATELKSVTDLRRAIASEDPAKAAGQPLLLTASVPHLLNPESSLQERMDFYQLFDLMFLQNFAFSYWSNAAALDSPLNAPAIPVVPAQIADTFMPGESIEKKIATIAKLNTASMASYYSVENTLSLAKLVVAIPAKSRLLTLADPQQGGIGAPLNEAASTIHPANTLPQIVPYAEVCLFWKKQGGKLSFDPVQQGTFVQRGNQWASFAGGEESMNALVRWTKQNKLGGAYVQAIDADDPTGKCDGARFPLANGLRTSISNSVKANETVAPQNAAVSAATQDLPNQPPTGASAAVPPSPAPSLQTSFANSAANASITTATLASLAPTVPLTAQDGSSQPPQTKPPGPPPLLPPSSAPLALQAGLMGTSAQPPTKPVAQPGGSIDLLPTGKVSIPLNSLQPASVQSAVYPPATTSTAQNILNAGTPGFAGIPSSAAAPRPQMQPTSSTMNRPSRPTTVQTSSGRNAVQGPGTIATPGEVESTRPVRIVSKPVTAAQQTNRNKQNQPLQSSLSTNQPKPSNIVAPANRRVPTANVGPTSKTSQQIAAIPNPKL